MKLAVVTSSLLAALASAGCAPVKRDIQPVSNWGGNPSGLNLHVYVPARLTAKPAIILALHYCGGSGPAYSGQTKYNSLADTQGFIVLYPSSPKDNNCWDVASAKSLTHEGGGDSTGLANMVKWALTTYNGDPAKVFVTGSSSGCMMSNVMAVTYPDMFAAVSCYSGVAAGCLAGSPGASPTTADPTCANGEIVKTGEQWAAQARAMYPGYTGAYPRVQVWHGEADFFVHYKNMAEIMKQWSSLLSVPFSKNNTDTPQSGYTQMIYGDGTKLVGYSARGVGHTVPVHEEDDLRWFGISG